MTQAIRTFGWDEYIKKAECGTRELFNHGNYRLADCEDGKGKLTHLVMEFTDGKRCEKFHEITLEDAYHLSAMYLCGSTALENELKNITY